MTEQVLDLRRFLQIVRRQKVIVITAAVLGLLVGGGLTLIHPPLPASKVLVLLPPSATRNISTQVVIAGSDQVLAGAMSYIRPPVTLQAMQTRVHTGKLTSTIVSITAEGNTGAQAEITASAVAESYIDYVGRKNNPGGRLQAQVLPSDTKATVASLRIRLIVTGLVGLLLGLLIGVIVAVAVGRNRHRLRERGRIASAARAPVLASIPVRHPSGVAGWTRLFEEYQPSPAHMAGMDRVLDRVRGRAWDMAAPRSLLILSLASDPAALAFGPQLAAYAASLGIPTDLVVAAQQDEETTATLRAACDETSRARSIRARMLVLHAVHDGDPYRPSGAALAVVAGVINGRTPRVSDMMPTTATMLAISAGAATARELARVAASCSSEGRQLGGVIVADPDLADQTTGLVPPTALSAHLRGPNRLTG
ncbi:MAG: Wzz/FepE/Etk N-terminal domain-containing protein [Streptosporangiaceae bacterium]